MEITPTKINVSGIQAWSRAQTHNMPELKDLVVPTTPHKPGRETPAPPQRPTPIPRPGQTPHPGEIVPSPCPVRRPC